MKSFIIYNALGEILRTGRCPDKDLQLQAGSDESVMEGIADDSLHIIVDEMVVDKPLESEESKNAELLLALRIKRDFILTWCDWTQLSDSPLTDSDKIAWQAYRQELRDLPETYSDATPIDQVVFPNPPN
jgi:hypothetical protein